MSVIPSQRVGTSEYNVKSCVDNGNWDIGRDLKRIGDCELFQVNDHVSCAGPRNISLFRGLLDKSLLNIVWNYFMIFYNLFYFYLLANFFLFGTGFIFCLIDTVLSVHTTSFTTVVSLSNKHKEEYWVLSSKLIHIEVTCWIWLQVVGLVAVLAVLLI